MWIETPDFDMVNIGVFVRLIRVTDHKDTMRKYSLCGQIPDNPTLLRIIASSDDKSVIDALREAIFDALREGKTYFDAREFSL
jgi:ferredoxin-NADP reductase